MATAQLRLSDLRTLPPVCTRCGAAATDAREEEFTFTPQWAQFSIFLGMLPLYILVKMTQKRVKLPLPVCDRHRQDEWTFSQKVVFAGLALGGVVAAAGCVLGTQGYEHGGDVAVYGVAGMVLMGMASTFVPGAGVRTTHIGADTITLDRVSPEFATAAQDGASTDWAGPVGNAGGMELQTAKYFRPR